MCNAKTEDRFRRYGGPVMKEGEIEMLGEGGGDVSPGIIDRSS
jgi:hypothetical protein